MTAQMMHGGPLDGQTHDVPDGVHVVAVPLARVGGPGGSGLAARSLAELEPEIRFDRETGAITAPPELVLEITQAHYDRSEDGFTYREEWRP